MERQLTEFLKQHPIYSAVIAFVFESLPAWLQLLVPTTGGTAMITITWLSWLSAIVGTGLLITIIVILRKPTLADVPVILQKMHDRISTRARDLANMGQVYITDEELEAIVKDWGNITLTDLSLFEQISKHDGNNVLDIMKEKSVQFYEQIAVFLAQLSICFERYKKILPEIKVSDRKYRRMKKQLNNLVFPNPDKKVIDSVSSFEIISDGLNNLFLLKPYLSESNLVKSNLSFLLGILDKMVYLDKLDKPISLLIGERRRQVAQAIDEYLYQKSIRGKK